MVETRGLAGVGDKRGNEDYEGGVLCLVAKGAGCGPND